MSSNAFSPIAPPFNFLKVVNSEKPQHLFRYRDDIAHYNHQLRNTPTQSCVPTTL
ncbi:uncharacterized protein BKA78DRAFT_323535, partial [Phyllosticta capitalensis]|uniref:uncharacterized protein n=1 Tax=Phyllosticta capitalensis TaxID=121624 RepID=UPI003131DECB